MTSTDSQTDVPAPSDGSGPTGPDPTGAADPVIVCDRVDKRYDDVVAVDGVDFEIGAGEFFSLLGPSGCGKTTTLRMIAGFEQPTSGSIRLEGREVAGVPPYRRNVNTVFQHYALFPHLTVADNVAFGPRSLKVPADEVTRRVTELLRVVHLDGLDRRKPNQLSGGQQQRVALARALASYPAALLLDEPLGALDLKLRQAMQLELKRIQREVGIAFVYVTHDQWEALTMSDRIAVMHQGRVEQIASPTEIYDEPRSVFVAGFLGDGNLLDTAIDPVGGPGPVEATVAGTTMPARTNQAVADGDATLLIRPDRIVVHRTRPDGPAVEVTVTDLMFQGATLRLSGEAPNGDGLFAHPGRYPGGDEPRPGDRTWWTWERDAALVLPGRPGRRDQDDGS